MIGSVVEACTRATRSADAPMEVISHDAPTDWISPPKFEARLAIQTARKMRCRKGRREIARLSDPSASFSALKNDLRSGPESAQGQQVGTPTSPAGR